MHPMQVAVVFAAAAAVEWQYQCSARRIETAGNPADVSFTRFMSLLCLVFDRKVALVQQLGQNSSFF